MSRPPAEPTRARRAVRLEIVDDRAAVTRPDEGFLHLRRLVLVSVGADGARSAPFPCDMVSRRQADAVAVVVWARAPGGEVQVVLRENLRPPVWLRRAKTFTQPDRRRFDLLTEIVAGLLEPADAGPRGISRRAAAEVLEEVGFTVRPSAVRLLGGPHFPTPGITDEKVFFTQVQVDLAARGRPTGDGSVQEEAGRVLVLPLEEALARCRDGRIPDMKTEIGLERLKQHLLPARRARKRTRR